MDYNYRPKEFEVTQKILEKKMKVVCPPPISKHATTQAMGSKPTVFSHEEESELVYYVSELQKILFRLTIHDVKLLAEQLLRKNRRDHNIRANPSTPGNQWVLGFMKRHPQVILRIPSSTSTTALRFSKAELKYFYDFLDQMYLIQKITPDRIYNTDDIEISAIAKDNTVIRTGRKRSIPEKESISVKVCINADGEYIPCMMIFLNDIQPNLPINVSSETWAVFNDTGSITTELFVQWLQKFISFSGAKKERPVLLLFDGQATYVKSIEVIKITRENGIIMISFPPFTRHLLQPLGNEFVESLNMFYIKEFDSWLQSNPGQRVSTIKVVDIFHKAFKETATSTITERFKNCGIFPLDANVFAESDFSPPVTTKNVKIYEQKPPSPPRTIENSEFTTWNRYYNHLYNDPRPGCSFWPD